MIDCHCHIDSADFEKVGGAGQIVARAKAAGLKFVINASHDWQAANANLKLFHEFNPFVKILAGMSPHDSVSHFSQLDDHLQFIEKNRSKIVGLGEIGMDFHHYSKKEDFAIQEKVFSAQLQLAESYDLPVVIHSRKAESKCFEILSRFRVRAVMHCFFVHELAAEAVKRGYLVSIPTLKSKDIKKTVQKVPLEQLACETDSPWLWETWPNEPANVKFSYEQVAKYKELPFEKVERQIDENVTAFFKL